MSGALEFAAGFGQGYLNSKQRLKDEERRDRIEREQKERQDKQDAMQAESHRRSLDSSDLQLGEARAGRDLRLSLADAARPREAIAGAGGMIRPETMDNRDVGLPENQTMPNQGLSLGAARVGNQAFATQPEADKFAQSQNKPEAIMSRQSLAYAQAGQPTQAAAMEKQRREYADWMKKEGLVNVADAAMSGNPRKVHDVFNTYGEMRLKGVPQVKDEIRDINGLGKIKTYTYSGTVIDADGSEHPFTKNSHDLKMETFDFKEFLNQNRLNTENASKQDDRVAKAGIAEERAKSAALLSEARAAVLDAKRAGGGGAGVGREERIRYTSLLAEAGRRMEDTNKAIRSVQADLSKKMDSHVYARAKPGSAEEKELMALREQISDLNGAHSDYKAEREQWSSLLSGSQTGQKPVSLADAKKNPTGKSNPAKISSDYSTLWK